MKKLKKKGLIQAGCKGVKTATGAVPNLQDPLGQISVVLLRDLGLVGGPVKDLRVVIDVVDVDDDGGVVLVEVVRGHETQLVL